MLKKPLSYRVRNCLGEALILYIPSFPSLLILCAPEDSLKDIVLSFFIPTCNQNDGLWSVIFQFPISGPWKRFTRCRTSIFYLIDRSYMKCRGKDLFTTWGGQVFKMPNVISFYFDLLIVTLMLLKKSRRKWLTDVRKPDPGAWSIPRRRRTKVIK